MNVVARFNGCSDSHIASIQAIVDVSDYAKRVGGKWLAIYRESTKGVELVQGIDYKRLPVGRVALAIVEM